MEQSILTYIILTYLVLHIHPDQNVLDVKPCTTSQV